MESKKIASIISDLERQAQERREASLRAVEQGDYMTSAQLTRQVSHLNRIVLELRAEMLSSTLPERIHATPQSALTS
jgi:hypothetical protein